MDVVIEAKIKGAFGGWKQGDVFVLNQGYHKKWKQVEGRYQFGNAYRPKAKLLRDGSAHYLEVERMDDMVEVKRAYARKSTKREERCSPDEARSGGRVCVSPLVYVMG